MTSPFEVLGVPYVFSLDENELERRHRDLSKALHPDRYAGRPSSERREALSRAITVNEAFRKLRDPITRAEALLERLGRAVTESNQPKPDPALLMQVMEEREALAAARRAGDRAKVEGIAAQASGRAEDATDRMADAFSVEPVPVEQVLKLLGELRYLRRLKEEAGAALDEL
ncbi:MAG TPA: Fe-S protein assembly co-chaperone HscB [Polyangiaceae bacterium]|nr:Fe-S protein assembly co-chaperone HscB [Polyangiaceae bacterium]